MEDNLYKLEIRNLKMVFVKILVFYLLNKNFYFKEKQIYCVVFF